MNDLVDLAVRVLRDETGVEADGAMTRQRIEAEWLQHRARGRAIRKMIIAAAVTLVVGGGALAATTLVPHARPTSSNLLPARTPRPEVRPARTAVAPSETVTSAAFTEAASSPIPTHPSTPPSGNLGRSADAATSAYAAAHHAHFLDRDWSRALALWTRYLRLAPRGQLAPEAHFNRAICLFRLDRRKEATAELQPFAIGLWGSYRQREARQLLDTLAGTVR